MTDEATALTEALFNKLELPAKAVEDAFHIAIAICSGMDYLLTWNCKHIANARMAHKIDSIAQEFNYPAPVICTPQELMEDYK
ncbi:MAG: PIN domain-containing protein [Planctomycetota bacterium]